LFPELEEGAPRSSTGILPSQDIERLINVGAIRSSEPIPAAQIQPSSLDLRIGPLAYQVEASFLPDTLEVVAVAYPEPNREVRVTMFALPAWLRPLDNPYISLRYDLLRELRHRISQEPGA